MGRKRHSLHSKLYLVALGLVTTFLLFHTFKSGEKQQHNKPYTYTYKSNAPNFDFVTSIATEPEVGKTGLAKPWGVTYSPLTNSGTCKSAKQIKRELVQIEKAGIDRVRIFSPDCDVLYQVPTQLRLLLGIHPYFSTDYEPVLPQLTASLTKQINEIDHWGWWDKVDMLVVGSQGVFNDEYSRSDLVRMIHHVKELLHKTQFRGLVTTAEPVQSWVSPTKYNAASVQEYKRFLRNNGQSSQALYNEQGEEVEDTDICSAVDVVSLVVQPYFNAALLPQESGRLISRDVRFARYLCSDDFIGRAHRQDAMIEDIDTDSPAPPIAVLEAGWPSDGLANGNAVAGANEQRIAVDSMVRARDTNSHMRIATVLYSWSNEQWRDPGEFDAEQYFGISSLY